MANAKNSHRLGLVSAISCRKGQNSIIRVMHVNAKTTFALSGNSVTLHKSSA
jgi:hypothetical protein